MDTDNINKYYTPDIREFHVGFEYVYNTGIASEPNWVDGFMIDEAWQIQDIYEELPHYIRVKHLDAEDIESLGFVVDCAPSAMSDDIVQVHQLCNDDEWFNIEKLNNRHIISKCTVYNNITYNFNQTVLFNGIIKNKSELKVLLKQLGINE